MVHYRRDKTYGATYFFTIALNDRKSDVATRYISALGRSIRRARRNNSFRIEAIVVLPDHIHMIMELPDSEADYSTRLRQIKTYFSQEVISSGEPLLRNRRGEYNLWQRRFWEHRIRNESDFNSHVNYIHFNPVKHGLVKEAMDWPFSSFHRYVRDGLLPPNWGSGAMNFDFGEVIG